MQSPHTNVGFVLKNIDEQVNFTHAFSWKEGHEMIMASPSLTFRLFIACYLLYLFKFVDSLSSSIHRSLSNIQLKIYAPSSVHSSSNHRCLFIVPCRCSSTFYYSSKEPQSDSSHRINRFALA